MIDTEIKIKNKEEIGKICEELKAQGKKIVTTNGTFDILHAGHLHSLKEAKKHGDIFIVGLNSDSSVKQYKSADRPFIDEVNRAEMLAALEIVDYVVLFDETDPNNFLSFVKPHFHVKSKSGYLGLEEDTVKRNGGEIVLIDDIPGISTTNLMNKIASSFKKSKAVFLDRDGTINRDVGHLRDPEKFELLNGSIDALKKLQSLGFKLVVVTNQSGITRGYQTEEEFHEVNREMFRLLSPHKINISKIYYCPHYINDDCKCRKPKTGMIDSAVKEFNIDVKGSYMIGDKPADIGLGKNSGCKSVRVLTGILVKEGDIEPDYTAKDLVDAANWIAEQESL